jgi:hypothetical protein
MAGLISQPWVSFWSLELRVAAMQASSESVGVQASTSDFHNPACELLLESKLEVRKDAQSRKEKNAREVKSKKIES